MQGDFFGVPLSRLRSIRSLSLYAGTEGRRSENPPGGCMSKTRRSTVITYAVTHYSGFNYRRRFVLVTVCVISVSPNASTPTRYLCACVRVWRTEQRLPSVNSSSTDKSRGVDTEFSYTRRV